MIMIIIINEKDRWNLMAKYFFSSSFLLFLGNWIGQVGLNWFVLTTYHNAVYLGLVNFCRLIPILLLSIELIKFHEIEVLFTCFMIFMKDRGRC